MEKISGKASFTRGWLTLWGMVTVFTVYKIVYPFPDFMPDSYYYIKMAHSFGFVPALWPVGYGWFLRAVHFLFISPFLFVTLQYVMIQAASLWLVRTLFTLFSFTDRVKNLILAFVVINPLVLYEANLVSSDAPFTALSLCWITLLIKLIRKPHWGYLVVQIPLVAYMFTMRHQAMYYPVLLLIALLFVRYSWRWKLFSLLATVGLIGWFVQTTRLANEREIGIKIFTGFSGWQIANNALYMYPHVAIDTTMFDGTPQELIDRQMRQYLDTIIKVRPHYTPADGPQYLLSFEGALKYYQFHTLRRLYPGKHTLWYYHKAGELYGEYGKKIIISHPVYYIWYYLLPNIRTYLLPLLEQFGQYNEGHLYVWPDAQQWFLLGNVYCYWWTGSFYLMAICSGMFMLINLLLAADMISFFRKRKSYSLSAVQYKGFLFLFIAFACNAAFSILAAPIVLRYQLYAMILGLLLLCILHNTKSSAAENK